MKVRTFTGVPRAEVEAIFANKQRAYVAPIVDSTFCGDVLRFVSDEAEPRARLDVLRAVTHSAAFAGHIVLSIRPLVGFEKDAIKAEAAA